MNWTRREHLGKIGYNHIWIQKLLGLNILKEIVQCVIGELNHGGGCINNNIARLIVKTSCWQQKWSFYVSSLVLISLFTFQISFFCHLHQVELCKFYWIYHALLYQHPTKLFDTHVRIMHYTIFKNIYKYIILSIILNLYLCNLY